MGVNIWVAALVLFVAGCSAARDPKLPGGAGFIRVSEDGTQFEFSDSGVKFTPWGFNYDHDRTNRLLEYYWNDEWDAVASDFKEMKALGANTVRIHLQLSRFMKSAEEVNQQSVTQLTRLLQLAETTGLYLDITGLGCYDKPDVPQWYNDLDEAPRWEVQARFWEAIARACRHSPAEIDGVRAGAACRLYRGLPWHRRLAARQEFRNQHDRQHDEHHRADQPGF